MKFMMRAAWLFGLALVLAPPAFAQRNDSSQPGSVIVFPKFIQGTTVLPEGGAAPITELEIGVLCPTGVTCPADLPLRIRFQWVCGATVAASTCKGTDFIVTATINEKIILTPNGEAQNSYSSGLPTKTVPAANCPNGGGYLIGWVVNLFDEPIKFDGLIGEAHLRQGAPVGTTLAQAPSGPGNSKNKGTSPPPAATALASYNAIPILAANTNPGATGSLITISSNGGLLFDGVGNDYSMVTGQITGDVRYTNLTTGPTFTQGVLTLLTLDVQVNRSNNPVFVDLDFFGGNPSNIGNENQLSTSTQFICWAEVPINAMNSSLTTSIMGREGVFVSGQATNTGPVTPTPVTLLGLVTTLEGGVFPPTAPWPRASVSSLFNSGVPVPTSFVSNTTTGP
jgi:hypothetical protein